MKTFRKIYVEITNKCNLSCSFCPGTKRPGKFLNASEFSHILQEIKPHTDFVYFHLMGEPLLHPHFFDFIDMAAAEGLKVCITTNGTLLKKHESELLKRLAGSVGTGYSNSGSTDTGSSDSSSNDKKQNNRAIHKISISIQAMEANDTYDFSNYLQNCFEFGKLVEGKTIIAYRLWNEGGANKENDEIIKRLHQYFPKEWTKDHNSYAIGNRIFLELGDKFDWPSPNADYIYTNHLDQQDSQPDKQPDKKQPDKQPNTLQQTNDKKEYYCYGLKDQLGILSDGTVVPCCLDAEGCLSLGNIFETPLTEIINSPRAIAIKEAFKNRRAAEDLCKRCGYASRFIK